MATAETDLANELARIKQAKVVKSFCYTCPWQCPTEVYVRDGRIVYHKGNSRAPNNIGSRCAKGMASWWVAQDPDRLKYPMLRTNPKGEPGRFRRGALRGRPLGRLRRRLRLGLGPGLGRCGLGRGRFFGATCAGLRSGGPLGGTAGRLLAGRLLSRLGLGRSGFRSGSGRLLRVVLPRRPRLRLGFVRHAQIPGQPCPQLQSSAPLRRA